MVIRKAGMVGIALATLPIDALALALLFGGPDQAAPPPAPTPARPPAARPAPTPPAARSPAPTVPRPPAPFTTWRLYPYDPEGWGDDPADLEGPAPDDYATV
jgi:hypothetical protein